MKYRPFIEDNLSIVDKFSRTVKFKTNKIQKRFILEDFVDRCVILKARQQGFSSAILAMFLCDFILCDNSYSIIIADIDENAELLLQRLKFFFQSYCQKNHIRLKLKNDSKTEMYFPLTNSRITVGTARNVDFGRSRTVTNLLLSEAAFYPEMDKIIAGAGQAVVEGGKFIIETTANGYGQFYGFWDDCKCGKRDFKPLFYKASDFYDEKFLKKKKAELGRMFCQEYPETAEEAFLRSGDCYFDTASMGTYLQTYCRPAIDYPAFSQWTHLRSFRELGHGENIVIGADCSAGGKDRSCAVMYSKTKLDVPMIYHTPALATEMTNELWRIAEKIYDITGVPPMIAYERNNGGLFEMERLIELNRKGKYLVFRMPNIGQQGNVNSPRYGWDTTGRTRGIMLPHLKQLLDKNVIPVYDRDIIQECLSFVCVNTTSSWKAQADVGAHDDRVMALAIALQVAEHYSEMQDEDGYMPEPAYTGRCSVTGY